MKVRELIEELEKYDQEATVVLSSDEEGNSYRKAWSFDEGVFDTTDKSFYSDSEEAEEKDFTESEGVEYEPPSGERCVVIV